MSQLELIPMTQSEKGKPGAQWWVGAYECRNFEGYFQQREQGRGPWQFVIYGFGFDDVSASIYRVRQDGNLEKKVVPINGKDILTVNGRKYGRANWCH